MSAAMLGPWIAAHMIFVVALIARRVFLTVTGV